MNRDQAIKRIKMYKEHFRPTKDFYREVDGCTFNFELAAKVVHGIRPEQHYKAIECMGELSEGLAAKDLSKHELRIHTNKMVKKLLAKLIERKVFTVEQVIDDIDFVNRCTMQVGLYGCAAVTTKFAVQLGLYAKSIKNLGTQIHEDALRKAATLEEMGCFCLTELGHGSDVSKLETTAHFDPEANEFVINSPTETSMKFWIGNLAKTACMAVVFAHLYTERVNQGVHGFLVPIRDKRTHSPLPGLEIGDCGDKIGLQGVDNGWIKFHQYRVPKASLLNRFGDVRADGVYYSMVSSKSKRFQFQIGSLSGGRIAIAQVSADIALAALTTTLRFFAVRKQFKNPVTKQETLLLDYRINQYRLLSYFSKHFLFSIAVSKIVEYWNENLPMNLNPKNKNSSFIHMISSAAKAVISWESSLAANECRQALAGIGYSYFSGLRDILSISDLNRTWEGDNYVLFQQTGRLLLKNLSNLFLGKPIMRTCEFITPEIPEPEHFTGSLDQLKDLIKLLSIRANALVHETGARLQMAKDKLDEWDKSLSFYVYPMAHAYFHRFVAVTYLEFIEQFNEDKQTKQVFEKMGIIYAQTAIIDNAEFYRDYLSREQIVEIKENIMQQFKELRREIIAITYLLQFRDKMLGTIGASDLDSYSRFLNAVQTAEGCYGRPSEWRYLYE